MAQTASSLTTVSSPSSPQLSGSSSSAQTGKRHKKPRRSSGKVRKQHLDNGAFLIEYSSPPAPRDMFGTRVLPVGVDRPPLHSGKERQSAVDKYRTMERKGYRVTLDTGCLIPDDQYGTYQQGATFKGHQRSFAFFAHWVPTQSVQATRNEWGWPTNLQISHLCHRRSCCRIDHLIAEEQWRNLKRNYCGSSGECDCGNQVKCIRRYHPMEWTEAPSFCESKDAVQEVLAGTPKYQIHGPDRFENRDAAARKKVENKHKRKRAQEKHVYETERKRARLGPPTSTKKRSPNSKMAQHQKPAWVQSDSDFE